MYYSTKLFDQADATFCPDNPVRQFYGNRAAEYNEVIIDLPGSHISLCRTSQ
jgi:hypothetical protein